MQFQFYLIQLFKGQRRIEYYDVQHQVQYLAKIMLKIPIYDHYNCDYNDYS